MSNEALNEIMALKRKLQQEMDKNKKLEKKPGTKGIRY